MDDASRFKGEKNAPASHPRFLGSKGSAGDAAWTRDTSEKRKIKEGIWSAHLPPLGSEAK